MGTSRISRIWNGGGVNNDGTTSKNWILGTQPLNDATADLIFAGTVRLAPGVVTAWNVHSITFDNTAGAFTITGPQGITIGSGGIVNNDTQTQTITAAITLSANEIFRVALNIGSGAAVTLGAIPPAPAPEFVEGALLGSPALPVPEPGTASLLAVALLVLSARRKE